MKTTQAVIVILMGCLLFLGGCSKKEDPGPTYTLNGYWDRGDIVVYISGPEGTFYQISSGYWKDALEQGFIQFGSLKFRYLVNVKEGFWTGQELWNYHSGSTINDVGWSETGEFTLTNEGNTLTVTTKDPWEGDYETSEYARVNP